jgi:hypothetical protein
MIDLEKTMGSVSLEEVSHRVLERLGVKATWSSFHDGVLLRESLG